MAFSDTIGVPNYLDTLLPIPVSRSGKAFLFLLLLPFIMGFAISGFANLEYYVMRLSILGLGSGIIVFFFKFIG